MAAYSIYKETSLPGTLTPDSIYLVAPAGQTEYLEVYVTNSAGTATRRSPRKQDIDALINQALADMDRVEVVADILARDALQLFANTKVLVLDASADPEVTSGAATYVWIEDTNTWVKTSSEGNMNVSLAWADISEKPTSSPSAIDSAVSNAHNHSNKTQLDKVGQDGNGDFQYNGQSYVKAGGSNW